MPAATSYFFALFITSISCLSVCPSVSVSNLKCFCHIASLSLLNLQVYFYLPLSKSARRFELPFVVYSSLP